MHGGSDPFQPEPLRLIDGDPSADEELLRLAVDLLGGTITHEQGERVRGVLVRAGPNDVAKEAARSAANVPVLVFPSATDAISVRHAVTAFAELAGVTPATVEPAACQEYRFADDALLAPFSGLKLSEHKPRVLPTTLPSRRLDALVSSEHGVVFMRCSAKGRTVYLSLVPPPGANDVALMKNEFADSRFMGLLALLVFARAALGDAGWRMPQVGASFLVDDPNLRLRRYGFLRLDAILRAARSEDFHLALAMIPIDFAKTRAGAAALVSENQDRVSIVLHGVDHRRLEFESKVTREGATSQLMQAQVRMETHRRRTGVPHAPVMTFPHGGCNETWLAALAAAGFDAALASRALPFAHDTGLGNALYEMHPAELAFAGFPMINRFKAEEPVERLLFQAWLGKPLVVYTHHEFFRDGLDRIIEIARFLNRQIRPGWQDIGSLVAANYQVRETSSAPAVRVFSNRVTVTLDRGLAGVLKPAPAAVNERATLNGAELALTSTPSGIAAAAIAPQPGSAEMAFVPPGPSARTVVPHVAPLSRARRLATEVRDQSSPLAASLTNRARSAMGKSDRAPRRAWPE